MGMRSLLVKGVVAGSLAAGSLGFTAVAAHANSPCDSYFQLQGHYYDLYRDDYQNYLDTSGTAGGQPAADYYYTLYQDDYSTYLFYTSRLNTCNLREP